MEPLADRRKIRALSMLSGGLDSTLAICVLSRQGIEVDAVTFDSPFYSVDKGRAAAAQLGVRLHVVNFSHDILSLLDHAPHGYGKCMNPCVDCHAAMLRRAGELMTELGHDFLSTGEVLNQRPMSQNRQSLGVVARESGYGDLVVRPLSAQLLPETLPEREGWVDRSRLLAIHGRGRREQMELAEEYGIRDYPSPAGGCRLTEPNYCRRLWDLKEHEGLTSERSLVLLRYGRHFRLADRTKLIVGRNEADNAFLEGTAELYDVILRTDGVRGPTAILPLGTSDEHVLLGARICAGYSDASPEAAVSVKVRTARGINRVKVTAADRTASDPLMIR